MRKRLIQSTVAVAAIVCVVLVTIAMLPAMLQPRPGVTKGNFDRVANGMTHEEVSVIFGRNEDAEVIMRFDRDASWNESIWNGADKSSASIEFQKNIVIDKTWTESTETAGEKLCRWVHWPWW
jgi:hypothetical protein